MHLEARPGLTWQGACSKAAALNLVPFWKRRKPCSMLPLGRRRRLTLLTSCLDYTCISVIQQLNNVRTIVGGKYTEMRSVDHSSHDRAAERR